MALIRKQFSLPLPEDLRRILSETPALSRAFVVGGSVRDALLGHPGKDFDIEVFGVSYQTLTQALTPHGRVDLVGKSFGVVKLATQEGVTYDFSLPRRDSKVAAGHQGFVAEFDPNLALAEASGRRDFTINALMFDPHRQEILDHHGGLADLESRILRHTTPHFTEDPLRVLRGMQFVARFDLTPAPETLELCRTMSPTYPELAKERVRDEWFKWAARSVRPAAGLRFLADAGWLLHFPEIDRLRGVAQEPEWHPEGDVFTHTGHCCDAMAQLPAWQQADDRTRIVWMLAILSHDFGKPATTRTEIKHGQLRIVSPDHEAAGGPIAEEFLQRINVPKDFASRVIPLVTNHLAHLQTGTDRAIRRLANRLAPETIEGLCVVMTADIFGRPPRPQILPDTLVELLRRSQELQLESTAPKPLLLGRHLLELGMPPGKPVGKIVHLAFEAQLDGAFANLEGALRWVADQSDLPLPEAAREQLDQSLKNLKRLK